MLPAPDFSDSAFDRTVAAFRDVSALHPGSGGQLSIRSARGLHVSVSAGSTGNDAWTRETVVNVWSVSKAISAVALSAALTERGHALETPVTSLWPELTIAGDLRIADLLAHRLGVVGLRRTVVPEDLLDPAGIAAEITRTEPWWKPGDAFGYHSWTYGVLVLELLRRLDVAIDDVVHRISRDEQSATATFTQSPAPAATLLPLDVEPSPASRALAERAVPETVAALRNPTFAATDGNSAWFGDLVMPSAKCLANADGVSLMLAQLLDGGAVARHDVATHLTGQGRGVDRVLGDDREFTAGLVVGHSDSACPYSLDGRLRFGHDGMGGSFVCVDPDAGLVMSWVTNGMGRDINTDPRKLEILEAFDDDTR